MAYDIAMMEDTAAIIQFNSSSCRAEGLCRPARDIDDVRAKTDTLFRLPLIPSNSFDS